VPVALVVGGLPTAISILGNASPFSRVNTQLRVPAGSQTASRGLQNANLASQSESVDARITPSPVTCTPEAPLANGVLNGPLDGIGIASMGNKLMKYSIGFARGQTRPHPELLRHLDQLVIVLAGAL
jgi:hypothetical protein